MPIRMGVMMGPRNCIGEMSHGIHTGMLSMITRPTTDSRMVKRNSPHPHPLPLLAWREMGRSLSEEVRRAEPMFNSG